MIGVLGFRHVEDVDRLTLRELLWMLQGRQYHDHMIGSHVVAGVWNAQRTKTSDRVWWFGDFHPDHLGRQKQRPTGRQAVKQVAQTWFAPGDIEWADGHSAEAI